jgi:hypothetical protein
MQIGCTKGQGGSARSMDALTFMQLNDYFISIWITTRASHGGGKPGHPSTRVGGLRQQNRHFMNARILNN